MFAALLVFAFNLSSFSYAQQSTDKLLFSPPNKISGYRDAAAELQAEKIFLSVPNAELAKEHLRTLTAEPHVPARRKTRRLPSTCSGSTRQPASMPTSRNTRS